MGCCLLLWLSIDVLSFGWWWWWCCGHDEYDEVDGDDNDDDDDDEDEDDDNDDGGITFNGSIEHYGGCLCLGG